MIEVVLNDRLGKKIRVKCNEDDTIGDLKKLAAAQLGTRPEKLKIQKWCVCYGKASLASLPNGRERDGMAIERSIYFVSMTVILKCIETLRVYLFAACICAW